MAALPEIPYNEHLIIFDFDCTLTTKHFYHFMNINNKILDSKVLEYIDDIDNFKKVIETGCNNITDIFKQILINEFFGGNERLEKLKEVLQKLKEYNCRIIIASKGKHNQIISLLKCLGLFEMFDEIHGDLSTKIELIYEKISNKTKYLYYFDDDRRDNDSLIKTYGNPKSIGLEKPFFEISTLDKFGYSIQYNFFILFKLFKFI